MFFVRIIMNMASVVLTTVVRSGAMLKFYRSITCVIAALACLSFVYTEKLRVCVVDGKGGFKVSTHYCPVLNKPTSKIECVVGLDRLDCLRRISKGTVDFTVLTPEDLVTAHTSEIEVLITNELRYTKDKYEYEVVAVVDKRSRIRSRHDLREKKYCHPGYGYETDWTRILANYFEASVVPQMCNPQLTITENRIKATSQFFKSSCKAGPWVNNFNTDEELKRNYPNLCELCDNPRCTMNDKYWGRRGPLFCLTDGAGDISWARWNDAQIHFGLTPGSTEASPDNYNLLCPDDTLMPLNTTNPCVWVVKPWPVVATKRSSAQDVQDIISNLTTSDSWQYAVLSLISASSLTVEKLNPIEAIETYLERATGYLSANSFSGCHPPRTIKICTTSIAENAKCAWLRESAAVYGIEPDIDCIKADNTTHCMIALNTNGAADVVMVPPDLTSLARREYNLKPLFYETVYDNEKYITVAITRHNSPANTLEDLRGKKACFPIYDGIAWNTVMHLLHGKDLLSCPLTMGMAKFFGPSCVPGLPNNSSLNEICKGELYNGEYGAIDCLTSGNGDVVFLSKNTFMTFLQDKTKNNNYKTEDFKILCEDSSKPCILSWSAVGYGMVRANSSQLWLRDTLDVFLQLDNLFGRNYKSLTTPFTMYGKYDEKSNLLFQDITIRLRDVPTAKNTDSMPNDFESIINIDKPCLVSTQAILTPHNILILFITVIIIFIIH